MSDGRHVDEAAWGLCLHCSEEEEEEEEAMKETGPEKVARNETEKKGMLGVRCTKMFRESIAAFALPSPSQHTHDYFGGKKVDNLTVDIKNRRM